MMRGADRQLRECHLLIVEGVEDALVFRALLQARNISGIQVEGTGGKSGIRDDLLAWTLTRGFEDVRWLGIAQDADDDPDVAFKRIVGALRDRKLPAPATSWSTSETVPAVAVFVLPALNTPGDLETLVWKAIEESMDPTVDSVDAFHRCLQRSRC